MLCMGTRHANLTGNTSELLMDPQPYLAHWCVWWLRSLSGGAENYIVNVVVNDLEKLPRGLCRELHRLRLTI